MDELIDNLLYAATFPEMDKWRRFSAMPDPSDHVMRIFVNAELRLQQRYGLVELERLVQEARVRRESKTLWGKLQAAGLVAPLMGASLYLMMIPFLYPRTAQA